MKPPFASQAPHPGPGEDLAGGRRAPGGGPGSLGSQVAQAHSPRPWEHGEKQLHPQQRDPKDSLAGVGVTLGELSPQVCHCPKNSVWSTRHPASYPGQLHCMTMNSVTPEVVSPQEWCHPRNSAPQELCHLGSSVTPGTASPRGKTTHSIPSSGSRPAWGPSAGSDPWDWVSSGSASAPPRAGHLDPAPVPADPRLTTLPSRAGGNRAGARSRRGCRSPSTTTAWPRRSASRRWSPCRGPGS